MSERNKAGVKNGRPLLIYRQKDRGIGLGLEILRELSFVANHQSVGLATGIGQRFSLDTYRQDERDDIRLFKSIDRVSKEHQEHLLLVYFEPNQQMLYSNFFVIGDTFWMLKISGWMLCGAVK